MSSLLRSSHRSDEANAEPPSATQPSPTASDSSGSLQQPAVADASPVDMVQPPCLLTATSPPSLTDVAAQTSSTPPPVAAAIQARFIVNPGEDIYERVVSFAREMRSPVLVLNASGEISQATILQIHSSGKPEVYPGPEVQHHPTSYRIFSFSGAQNHTVEYSEGERIPDGITIIFADQGPSLITGKVVGPIIAATPVQLFMKPRPENLEEEKKRERRKDPDMGDHEEQNQDKFRGKSPTMVIQLRSLIVNRGEDIYERIVSFARKMHSPVFVLNAIGEISHATILPIFSSSDKPVVYPRPEVQHPLHSKFSHRSSYHIFSFIGLHNHTVEYSSDGKRTPDGIQITFANRQEGLIIGLVVGPIIAATPVQLFMGPEEHLENLEEDYDGDEDDDDDGEDHDMGDHEEKKQKKFKGEDTVPNSGGAGSVVPC